MMFPAFTIELALKDILTNKKLPTAPEGVLREIRIYYTNKF
jgi:hypothetical protein